MTPPLGDLPLPADLQATVDDYCRGMHQGDVARLRSAFHPAARVVGVLRGAAVDLAIDEWLARVAGRPAPSVSGEPFDMQAAQARVDGTAASVIVHDLYLGLRFIDHLVLHRDADRWRIVAKVFTHR